MEHGGPVLAGKCARRRRAPAASWVSWGRPGGVEEEKSGAKRRGGAGDLIGGAEVAFARLNARIEDGFMGVDGHECEGVFSAGGRGRRGLAGGSRM